MLKFKKNNLNEKKLYNKILNLSRKKEFYIEMSIKDTFQNRINLIFIHSCFLFIKIKEVENNNLYKDFYQKTFDHIFEQIELNMREIGFGDVTVNKNMKYLVKIFYEILLGCELYKKKDADSKIKFFLLYLDQFSPENSEINKLIVDYFDKYEAFCFDLSSDSILKGNLNFNFK